MSESLSNPPSVSLPEPPNPNIPQREAATPDYDVWVAASAGSGKTKVLTDRVLRLLLPDPKGRWVGADPHRILCITFTKAAAAQMALRIQKKLADWSVMSDEELHKDLSALSNETIAEEQMQGLMEAARKLFSTVIDVTGGLSIMTIHSFCQSVLGRFAIEAGVTPGFSVMDETVAHELLRQIVDDLIRESGATKDESIRAAFVRMATYMDLDKLRETLLAGLDKSREFASFLKSCGNDDQKIRAHLLENLGCPVSLSQEDLYDDFFNRISEEHLRHIAKTLATGSDKFKKSGQLLADWLALDRKNRQSRMELFVGALFTQTGKVKDIGTKIPEAHPELPGLIATVVDLYSELEDKLAILRQVGQTTDLLKIIGICLSRYSEGKRKRNALDFNDLILKTRNLLETQSLEWVQYKLDEGIDHILVDEAQDTNSHQWAIVRCLSDEFLSGTGNDKRHRSLFVVGDEKQSIFSFHGADPKAFREMRDFFAARSQDAQRDFRPVHLETSFRSTIPVLRLVDCVFEDPRLSIRLGLKADQKLVHYSYRPKSSGLVEIWPPLIKEKADNKGKEAKWVLPSVSEGQGQGESEMSGGGSPLARQIAQTIWGWLQKGEILKSEDRKIEPRDILVLVRSRTVFVPDLVRQLKLRGIPVSGADRMKLTDQIAIMDCLALARFARLPGDDLSLACLLKSPFIRITEEELMGLALGRQGTLWDAVQAKCPPAIVQWLEKAIELAKTQKPFDFFDDFLNQLCPFGGPEIAASGWQAFSKCLGADCLDPLDEFLTYCLSQEAEGIYSLEELITQISKSDITIKRDAESDDKSGPNQIRIMTVHASKGLEAPIVFLPDTMTEPSRRKIPPLQWLGESEKGVKSPLWSAGGGSCKRYQELKEEAYFDMASEHLRLLYVALTRPQDRLYIMGEASSSKIPELSWYALAKSAFLKIPETTLDGEILRYESAQGSKVEKKYDQDQSGSGEPPIPDWVNQPAISDEVTRPRILRPSRLADEDEIISSPLDKVSGHRFRRGILTHKLFEVLPDIPVEKREVAARAFLDRSARDVPQQIRTEIMIETLKVLNDPVFADVFGEGSLSEVPVTGDLGNGQMVSGQIDRIVIKHNKILIVDYKTNRPSPKAEKDIPKSYILQLKAYKTAISRIYPDRDIRCALLWTDQSVLMPVELD